MKLHLGVVDVPYDDGEATTGEVAQILESEYHIMEIFADEMRDAISDAFAESARVALEDLMSGAPAGGLSLTFEATEEIGSAFRIFIDQQELDGVVPGVPTGASLRGVNHRLADPYAATNPPRPSFRDTGHYEDSFRAWTE
jgi:hypothetical protein